MNPEPVLSVIVTTSFALGGLLLLRPLLHRARFFRLLTFAWFLVSLRLLLPIGFHLPISLAWSPRPNHPASAAAVPPTSAPEVITTPAQTGTAPATTGKTAALHHSSNSSQPATHAEGLGLSWPTVLVLGWGMGVLFFLSRELRAHLALRRLLREARPLHDPRLSSIVANLARELGFKTGIRLRHSIALSSPAMCGFRRPCLLFPAAQIHRLSDDELRHILLHELAHWRHRDLHVQQLLRLARALHWFNPLSWLALSAFRQDCELASDHFVIRHTSPAETRAYGATLLKLLGWVRGQTTPATPALGVVGSSHHLKQRLHMLLHPRSCSLIRTTLTTLVITTLLLLSTLRPAFAADSPGVTTKAPRGWFENGNQLDAYTVGVDSTQRYHQPQSAYVKSDREVENKFGGMMQNISPENYIGQRVRLSGAIKTRDAEKGAHLWLRIDGAVKGNMLGFDNMADRPVKGTRDWTECSIVLDVPEGATNIAYGFFISNNGQAWVNDLKFEIVSKDTPLSKRDLPTNARTSKPVNLSFEP